VLSWSVNVVAKSKFLAAGINTPLPGRKPVPDEAGEKDGSAMIAFEVTINGKVLCTAGVGEYGFLFAELMWDKRNPTFRPKGRRKKEWNEELLRLRVSGLADIDERIREQLVWGTKSVSIGDSVVIRVLEQPACDEPKERDRYDRVERAKITNPPSAKAKRKKRRRP
jgi:hypothetical protein